MTTTISVSDDTKARFDDARPADVRSADEFLTRLLECWERGPDEFHAGDGGAVDIDPDALADAIAERVDADSPDDELLDALRGELEELSDTLKEIRISIDGLPKRTADEMEERMR